MSQAPHRNLPEKTNRIVSLLLSVFFFSVYFWNSIGYTKSFWFLSITIFISVILSYSLWALIHECIHGNFSNSRNESHLAGRILCILFGTPYQVAKTAHLMHHKFNRQEGDRIEYLEKNGRSIAIQKGIYYFKLFQGTYFLEVIGGFLLSLPLSFSVPLAEKYFSRLPVQKAFFKQIQKQEIVKELRIDSFLILLLYGSAFYLSGPLVWVLGFVLILRGGIVSFLDHSYHYGNGIEDRNSATNLSLPSILSCLFLNFNYHRVHHRFPGCSWDRLPAQFANSGDTMNRSLFSQCWNQFGGLLEIPESISEKSETS
ncbi:fatty acid desaturase [Leptospira sp. WS92.C1]